MVIVRCLVISAIPTYDPRLGGPSDVDFRFVNQLPVRDNGESRSFQKISSTDIFFARKYRANRPFELRIQNF